jgi:uncharacterized membrane protein YeiH
VVVVDPAGSVPAATGLPAALPFAVANAVGLLAFAAAGALKGADADLDLFGVTVLGVATALGGGTTRDVLVGRVPVALRSSGDVSVALVGVALGVAAAQLTDAGVGPRVGRGSDPGSAAGPGSGTDGSPVGSGGRDAGDAVRVRDHPAFLVSDAIGLAAFAATGALVGVDAGLSPFGVVTLATVTAVGGGSLADLLVGRPPSVLREDFYATPAVLGGATFWLAATAGVPTGLPSLACAAVALSARLLALRYGWRLPTL